MDILKDNNYEVSCIGKIYDIFNGQGSTKTQKTVSNADGMDKTIAEAKLDYSGLCYVNLVEFDSEYGHRRDVKGYARAIEEFDVQLGVLLETLNEDDLLIITADHGNDPTWVGSDHTREMVPNIIYSKSINNGKLLETRNSFADLGQTIIKNLNLNNEDHLIGTPVDEIFE